jgi:outer membrane protein OmpA-like peptidoglycan-associated protein
MRDLVRESARSKRNTLPRSTVPGPANNGESRGFPILQLQRTIGNAAVQRMLRIDESGDGDEREADRSAEEVAGSAGSRRAGDRSNTTGQAGAPPSVHAVLRSSGQPLDGATRAVMEPRFGYDFSQVRIHSDAAAAKSARDVNANAYTVGQHIVFGADRFVPHTEEGQRLVAHELTHVVQSSGAAGPALAGVVRRQPGQYYEKTEADVAESVIEALQTPNNIAGTNVDPAFELLNPHPLPFQLRVLTELFDRGYFYGLLGYLAPGTKASRELIVAIRFTQCQRDKSSLGYEDIVEAQQFIKYDVTVPPELGPMLDCLEKERVRIEKQREEERRQRALQEAEKQRQRELEKEEKRFSAAFEPGSEVCRLTKGVMQWHLYSATSAGGKAKKQRMQIKFLPDMRYRNRNMTVTFLQTMREKGGARDETNVDIGMNQSVFNPFYGVGWSGEAKRWEPSNEGADVGFRSRPSSTADPAAYMFDEPYFFPAPHGRVFESVAVVLETGETLGALTWGVGAVPADAQKPTCADSPSADYQGAVAKFYTPKSPAPEHGRENYDLVFDGFAPNGATLTADQKRQLAAFAAYVKEVVTAAGAGKTKGHLVVGGFGDSKDTDPVAASGRRAQAVADFLTGKGVPRDTLDLRPYGASWARYEPSAKRAQEGGNRRVQIRMFQP